MKRAICFLAISLIIMTGCGGGGSINQSDDYITIDVTGRYPQKELILQDFMDVEYIALETSREFLCQGVIQAIGNDFIIVTNRVRDGDIFIFDRNGKGLKKFNRMGRGGEEYINIGEIILDEENSEIFVSDWNKILVYDLFGNFKRSLRFDEGYGYASIYNFDSENLICQNSSFNNEEIIDKSPFVIISKHDGSINKEIQVSVQHKIPSYKRINHNGIIVTTYTSNFPSRAVIPYHNSWIITTYSNDTIFRYMPDHSVIPFMVRTPSIESNNAEAFLALGILTERYYFLQTQKIEPEVRGTTPQNIIAVFPVTHLMFDRQENRIYEYTVYNDDFSPKRPVENLIKRPVNNEIVFWQRLEADDLFDAYREGQLKGRLKEIAAGLKEEDNPVIMLVKHKR